MFGPTGDGAHIHVHWQIRATFNGTLPIPGSGTCVVKSVVENTAATSAMSTLPAAYALA